MFEGNTVCAKRSMTVKLILLVALQVNTQLYELALTME